MCEGMYFYLRSAAAAYIKKRLEYDLESPMSILLKTVMFFFASLSKMTTEQK